MFVVKYTMRVKSLLRLPIASTSKQYPWQRFSSRHLKVAYNQFSKMVSMATFQQHTPEGCLSPVLQNGIHGNASAADTWRLPITSTSKWYPWQRFSSRHMKVAYNLYFKMVSMATFQHTTPEGCLWPVLQNGKVKQLTNYSCLYL